MKFLLSILCTVFLFFGLLNNVQAARNSVVVGMQLEPPNLDPTGGAAAAIDEVVYSNVFEGLTRFQADGSVSSGFRDDCGRTGDDTEPRRVVHDLVAGRGYPTEHLADRVSPVWRVVVLLPDGRPA